MPKTDHLKLLFYINLNEVSHYRDGQHKIPGEFSLHDVAAGLSASLVAGVSQEGDDPLDWLRDSIPGEPGVDYPIHASVQETSFTCDGLTFGGYYADPEQECQVYHVCLRDPVSPDSLYPVSFLCPNGTTFNQEIFVCDWW